jgi:DNA-binding GntR family transcriptional regulator
MKTEDLAAIPSRAKASPAESADRKKEVSSPRRVMNAIVAGIQKGRYAPGQRLVEADLTRELQVSRGPVREAFKRLAGEGVLVLSKNRGAYIRAQTREQVRDTMCVLEALTGLAAKLAARHIDEGNNRSLFEDCFETAMEQGAQGETLAFLDERRRFYDALYEIAGNRELQRIVPRMQISLIRLQFQAYVSGKQHQSQLKELRAIAEAVLEGDPKKAESAAKAHLRRRRLSMTTLPAEAYAAAEHLQS